MSSSASTSTRPGTSGRERSWTVASISVSRRRRASLCASPVARCIQKWAFTSPLGSNRTVNSPAGPAENVPSRSGFGRLRRIASAASRARARIAATSAAPETVFFAAMASLGCSLTQMPVSTASGGVIAAKNAEWNSSSDPSLRRTA